MVGGERGLIGAGDIAVGEEHHALLLLQPESATSRCLFLTHLAIIVCSGVLQPQRHEGDTQKVPFDPR